MIYEAQTDHPVSAGMLVAPTPPTPMPESSNVLHSSPRVGGPQRFSNTQPRSDLVCDSAIPQSGIRLQTRAAVRYVSPREQTLNTTEIFNRDVAYDLKQPGSRYLEHVADRMAAKVDGERLVLCPVPSATRGDCHANLDLAHAVRDAADPDSIRDIQVLELIQSTGSMDSQSERHRLGEQPRRWDEFEFCATRSIASLHQLEDDWRMMFVDNVVTSGNTVRACANVLGMADACCLAWADACTDRADGDPLFM